MEILPQQFRAPDIYGNYWINADPVSLVSLRGYVLLIDFWDYTSVNCHHSLPYMREWYRRYSDKGLIIIGVHTPQFPFGRDPVNVQAAVDKLSIKYPVVMDNDFLVWNAFRCTSWPTKIIVDKNGFIRYIHAGEGQYQNMEQVIQSMVVDAGYRDDLPYVMDPLKEIDRPGIFCYRETPDILTGWQRGTIGNVEGYSPESTVHYEDPNVYVPGRLYLHGDWLNDRNYLKINTDSPHGGYLIVVYQAKEVYAVIKPEGEKSFQVFIQQDGQYLSRGDKGTDIRYDEAGRSYFVVNEARLYNLVSNREFGDHVMKLNTRSNGFAIFAMTFETSPIPELTI
jgi:thiol-disulfide isomerase/thioredoxin